MLELKRIRIAMMIIQCVCLIDEKVRLSASALTEPVNTSIVVLGEYWHCSIRKELQQWTINVFDDDAVIDEYFYTHSLPDADEIVNMVAKVTMHTLG